MCVPSARPAGLYGEVQAVNAPASTRHWNVTGAASLPSAIDGAFTGPAAVESVSVMIELLTAMEDVDVPLMRPVQSAMPGAVVAGLANVPLSANVDQLTVALPGDVPLLYTASAPMLLTATLPPNVVF